MPGPEVVGVPEAPDTPPDARVGVRCRHCGAENDPDRTLCVRCALVLDSGPPPEAPPPWWRRLLRRRRRQAPEAGARPRRRLWRRPRIALPLVLVLLACGLWFGRPYLPGLLGLARNETGTPESLPPTAVRASTAQRDHPATAAFDGFSNRYWAPAAGGPGTGEFLEADFEQPVRMMKLIVFAGVSPKKDEFLTQGRPARLLVELTDADGDRSTKRLTLKDQPGQQTFDVRGSGVVRIRLTTEASYGTGAGAAKGTRPAVAEVEFFGRR